MYPPWRLLTLPSKCLHVFSIIITPKPLSSNDLLLPVPPPTSHLRRRVAQEFNLVTCGQGVWSALPERSKRNHSLCPIQLWGWEWDTVPRPLRCPWVSTWCIYERRTSHYVLKVPRLLLEPTQY